MKMGTLVLACVGFLTLSVSTSLSRTDVKVLWITIKQDGELASDIAMPLSLVKTILGTNKDNAKVGIAGIELPVETLKKALGQTGGGLVTVFDHKTKSEIQISIREFKPVPESVKGGSSLVVEFYQHGEKSTTVELPNIVVRGLVSLFGGANIAGKEVGIEFIDALVRSGGFVYIRDYRSDSDMWVYEQ